MKSVISIQKLFTPNGSMSRIVRTVSGTLVTPLIKYSELLLFSALFGLIIAHLHITPTVISDAPSVATAQSTQETNLYPNSYPAQNNPMFTTHPTWSQDFTKQLSNIPNPEYWNVLVGPAQNSNNEQQYYTSDYANIAVENGSLRLTATNTPQANNYSYGSARIETQGKKSYLYGRIDITAKMPTGTGTWPAVWMLPANSKYADNAPENDLLRYKSGGEIDIIEAVGFYPNTVYGVAHTASDLALRSDGTGSHGVTNVPRSGSTFNKYSLLWTPTSLIFLVNDQQYYTYERKDGADYTTWPFDQPFYLIANLAIGGSWGGMDKSRFENGIDNSALPASLYIQSIYYYPYVGPADIQ